MIVKERLKLNYIYNRLHVMGILENVPLAFEFQSLLGTKVKTKQLGDTDIYEVEYTPKFSKNDRVTLIRGKYPVESINPTGIPGVIIDLNLKAVSHVFRVSWSNGESNCYMFSDLELLHSNKNENKCKSIW